MKVSFVKTKSTFRQFNIETHLHVYYDVFLKYALLNKTTSSANKATSNYFAHPFFYWGGGGGGVCCNLLLDKLNETYKNGL